MRIELRTAVYNLALTAPGITESNLFITAADQDASLPHVVIEAMPSEPNRDTAKQYVRSLFTFVAYSGKSQDEADQLITDLQGIFYNNKAGLDGFLTNWRTVGITDIQDAVGFFQDLRWRTDWVCAFEWEPTP